MDRVVRKRLLCGTAGTVAGVEVGDKDLLSGGEDFLKRHLDHTCLIEVRLRRRQVVESGRTGSLLSEWPQEGRGGRRVGIAPSIFSWFSNARRSLFPPL